MEIAASHDLPAGAGGELMRNLLKIHNVIMIFQVAKGRLHFNQKCLCRMEEGRV